MSKDTFRFKQFQILQTGSTLKVCTDSCLFGAWVASHLSEGKKVLDIGTGTGLLALMYEQKHTDSSILALEIDTKSAELARYNFDQSPWAKKIVVRNESLQTFTSETASESFDVILCNPPFFEKQLTSINETKNLAKHSSELTKIELVESIFKLLTKKGSAYVLLPPFEAEEFIGLATNFGLFLNENVTVRNKTNGQSFRQMMRFVKLENMLYEGEIVIYISEKVYTSEFVELLKEYYLYL